LHKWRYLSDHFFDKGFQERAIYLAQVAKNEDTTDPYFVTKLSSLLRKSGQPEMGASEFRKCGIKVEERSFFNEWATLERILDNDAIAVWIYSIALDDSTTIRRQNNKDSMFSLSGLAIAFDKLYEKYNIQGFIVARCSVAFIALHLRLDPGDSIYFKNHIDKCSMLNVSINSLNEAFNSMTNGIELAFDYFEIRQIDLPTWLPMTRLFSFNGLKQLIGLTPIEIKGHRVE
jgi:hypothetical protein